MELSGIHHILKGIGFRLKKVQSFPYILSSYFKLVRFNMWYSSDFCLNSYYPIQKKGASLVFDDN